MNVLPNSDIQSGNNRIYLNNEGQTTKLFFTSSVGKKWYFLMRDEQVIANGVLQGFKEDNVFNYRFDFINFIKIFNQESPRIMDLDAFGSYKFVGDNTCNLYFYVGDYDIIDSNIAANKLKVQEDGKIFLNRAQYTYNDLNHTSKAFTTFIDASILDYDLEGKELEYRVETQKIALRGSYVPITIYRNNAFSYSIVGNTVYDSPVYVKGNNGDHPGYNDGYILTETDGYVWTENKDKIALDTGMTTYKGPMNGYITYMIKVPLDATKISFNIYRLGTDGEAVETYIEEFIPVNGCMTPYYFWNDNGAYDTVYCTGVANKITDVEKEYINISGVETPLKITYVDKIKHNTGLTLKQEQIYSLIKSPVVHKIETKGNIPTIVKYNIDLESFEGYNGVNISQRNMELIFSKPRESRRVTNKQITFFD